MKTIRTATLVVTILIALLANRTTPTASAAQANCDQNWVTMCCDNTNQHYNDRNCDTFRRDHLACCVTPPDDDNCKLPDGVGYCSQKEPVCNLIVDKDKVGACPILDGVGKCAEPKLTDGDITKIALALKLILLQNIEPSAGVCSQVLNGETFPDGTQNYIWNCAHVLDLPMGTARRLKWKVRKAQRDQMNAMCGYIAGICRLRQVVSPVVGSPSSAFTD